MADDKKQGGTSRRSGGQNVSESSNTAALAHEIKQNSVFNGVRVHSNHVRNTMPSQSNPNRDPGRGGGVKDEK